MLAIALFWLKSGKNIGNLKISVYKLNLFFLFYILKLNELETLK